MQKAAAQKLVQETLQSSFNKERFVYLIKNILNHVEEAPFTYKGNFIFDDFADSIKTVERIGKYKGPEEKLLDILIVHLQKETSLERARTKQRNFVAKYLKGSRGGVLKDAALVAFVSPGGDDWRFSLVKMEYKFNEKGKVEEKFTPARRYSFLVGKNENSHTAQSRLLPLLLDDEVNPTLHDLEDVFSVERVTREFFEKYRDLFLRLKESLDDVVKKNPKVKADFESKDVSTVDFAKKLLGQIVFLYFLQKKGWFGVKRGEDWGEGDRQFLRHLFIRSQQEKKNYFNKFLEPLFYEALRLERPKDYYDQFECRIPFLNGGLFDPISEYDWQDTDIEIPNEIFSNTRKTKEGDTGDGILDIFDRYNFTVKEDEPLEKEVAVDPEMLGKVFENLLEVKDRKSKGTYYTPREIVHYMCQESLINYLYSELNEGLTTYEKVGEKQLDILGNQAKMGQQDLVIEHRSDPIISKENIETLIKYGESVVEHDSRVVNEGRETKTYAFKLPESVRKHAKLIDEKLASIRVCDPAVGSGAFPVGMMNEIIRARNALTPYLSPSPLMGEGGGEGGERSPYYFKRQAIQNCLYGVDVDPGAVEICKLRLWLSLVVDEESRETVQPLPNLDYKIVCGNSLLSVEKNLLNHQLFNKLEEFKPLYFNETSASKKQEYKKRIDGIISQITNGHKDFDFEVYFSEVFHEKKGFNVVIANPPYIKEYIHRDVFDGLRESPYYQGKMDIWYLFACKCIDMLKNRDGVLTFIAQNNWVTSYGASKMRTKVISDTKILSLLDFSDYKIFENAGIQTMVMLFQKNKNADDYNLDYRRIISEKAGIEDILDLLNRRTNPGNEYLSPIINRKKLINQTLTFSNSAIDAVFKKMLSKSDFYLNENEVANGIHHHHDSVNKERQKILGNNFKVGDGIFVLSDKEKNSIPFLKNELELIKPFYTTKELHKWYGNPQNKEWVIYTDSSFKAPKNIKPYPNIKAHLDKFEKVITSDNKPYGLHRARDENFFKGEKIIAVRKCAEPTFTYTDFDCYVSATFYVIKNDRINMKFITAILNSKLIAFWLRHKGKMQGNNYQIDKEPLLSIPIYNPSNKDLQPFLTLVDQILEVKQNPPSPPFAKGVIKDDNTSALERQIDEMVYALYGLTPDEIGVVEGNSKG